MQLIQPKALLKYRDLIMTVCLAICAAFFLCSLINYIIVKPPLVTLGTSKTTNSNTYTLNSIITRNIFDLEIKSSEKNVSAVANFDGKLKGILLGQDENDTIAIVVTSSKDVYALKVDTPVDGYKLLSVKQDSARLEYAGKEYELLLEGGTDTLPMQSPSAVRISARPATEEGTTEHISLDRAKLKSEIKDLNSVMGSLRVAPFYQDERFIGYRVLNIREDSPMKSLGFQAGDIINRINGEDLTSPQILFDALQRVDDIKAVSVDITRLGDKKTIFVEIQ